MTDKSSSPSATSHGRNWQDLLRRLRLRIEPEDYPRLGRIARHVNNICDEAADAIEELRSARSATPRITTMPLIKRLKDQRDELAQVVREIRTRMQSVHSAGQLGQEIAEKDRAWLAQVDAAIAKFPTYEQQLRNIAKGIGMTYEELIAAVNNATDGGTKT